MKAVPIKERFWSKVDKQQTCWVWVAGKSNAGYGYISESRNSIRKTFRAHCLAYEWLIGPIPKGLVLDHLCRNRACVNPAHLEAVSNKVNILRGCGLAANNATKTHCLKGHPLTGNNLYSYMGLRHCRACRKRHARERYRKLNVNTKTRSFYRGKPIEG